MVNLFFLLGEFLVFCYDVCIEAVLTEICFMNYIDIEFDLALNEFFFGFSSILTGVFETISHFEYKFLFYLDQNTIKNILGLSTN